MSDMLDISDISGISGIYDISDISDISDIPDADPAVLTSPGPLFAFFAPRRAPPFETGLVPPY